MSGESLYPGERYGNYMKRVQRVVCSHASRSTEPETMEGKETPKHK